MSFNAIRENKILEKIFEFTVLGLKPSPNTVKPSFVFLCPKLQCLLKVKEDLLSYVLIFRMLVSFFLYITMISLTIRTASIKAIY